MWSGSSLGPTIKPGHRIGDRAPGGQRDAYGCGVAGTVLMELQLSHVLRKEVVLAPGYEILQRPVRQQRKSFFSDNEIERRGGRSH